MGDASLQYQLHQFFGRRGHILETLPEGNDGKTHALQILHHLNGTPPVEGNFPDVKAFSQPFDELFDVAVVNHISLCGLEKTLSFPKVVWHMIPPDTQVDIFLGNPEIRQNPVFVRFILRRKYQYKGSNVGGAGKVQAAVADPAFQVVLGGGESASVPFVHRHPAHRLLDPLVQAKLSEGIFLAGILLGGFAGIPDFIDSHGNAQGRIRLFPHLGVCPVVRFVGAVDHGIEGVVNFPAFDNVQGFLVDFIADGFGVISGSGNEKIQRLHPGVTGTFGHDIKELPVGLSVQLVKHHAMGVEAVLISHIGGKHLINAACWQINEPLLGIQDFHPFCQSGAHPHHVSGHVEHNGGLLPVGGTAVDLGTFFTISAGKQQRHSRSQFGFALLFRNLNVGGVELAVTVGFQRSEDIPDDLFLPVNQLERLSSPGAFGVTQAFNKTHRIISSGFVVMGILGHKCGGCIFFQLSDMRSPPKNGQKKAPAEQTLPAKILIWDDMVLHVSGFEPAAPIFHFIYCNIIINQIHEPILQQYRGAKPVRVTVFRITAGSIIL